jgi:hypothetical protein
MSKFKITYFKDKDMSIGVHTGECGYNEILNGIKLYYEGSATKYAITDFSQAIALKISGEEVARIADYMRQTSKTRPPRSYDLLIVSGILKFGLARMYTTYLKLNETNDLDLKTEVFRSVEDAVRWIDRDIQLRSAK